MTTRVTKIGYISYPNKPQAKPRRCLQCNKIISNSGRPNKSSLCWNCKNSMKRSRAGRAFIKRLKYRESR